MSIEKVRKERQCLRQPFENPSFESSGIKLNTFSQNPELYKQQLLLEEFSIRRMIQSWNNRSKLCARLQNLYPNF